MLVVGLILILILLLLLVLPIWPYSRKWGYLPTFILSLVLVFVLAVFLVRVV